MFVFSYSGHRRRHGVSDVSCLPEEKRCFCQILYTQKSDGTTLTFNTSDVSSLFIIHLTQHPADSQHPHIQQRANNILSSDPFSHYI